MRRRLAVVGIIDQLIVSSRFLVLMTGLAIMMGQADFAVAALTVTVTQICLGIFSYCLVDQWLLKTSATSTSISIAAIAVACGPSLAVASTLALGKADTVIILLCLSVSGFLCLEFYRVLALRLGFTYSTLIFDSLPTAGALLGWLFFGDVVGLVGGSAAGGVIGAIALRIRLGRGLSRLRLRGLMDARQGGFFFADYMLSVGYGQLVVVLVAIALMPSEAATIRYAQLIFAVPGIAANGLRVLVLGSATEVTRLGFRNASLALGIAAVACAALVSAVVLSPIVSSTLTGVPHLERVVAPFAIQSVFIASGALGPLALKRSGESWNLVRARIWIVAVSLSLAIAGGAICGMVGVAYGLMFGSLVAFAAWQFLVQKLFTEKECLDAR